MRRDDSRATDFIGQFEVDGIRDFLADVRLATTDHNLRAVTRHFLSDGKTDTLTGARYQRHLAG